MVRLCLESENIVCKTTEDGKAGLFNSLSIEVYNIKRKGIGLLNTVEHSKVILFFMEETFL